MNDVGKFQVMGEGRKKGKFMLLDWSLGSV